MGIHVRVRLLRSQVSRATWERIYADSMRALRGWPDPPLGIGHREVAGVRVIAYTRNFERKDGWSIVGDANSRRGAESFELPTELHPSESPFGVGEAASMAVEPTMDVLQALAEEDAGKPSWLSCLLGSKTQGLPYHALIVAVATLIENRLPGVALACGDFDIEDADRACCELTRIFGEVFERPVLLDPARIHERVPDLDAASLSKRHTLRTVPEVAAILERFCESQRTGLPADLEAKALVCTDVDQLCEGTRMAFAILGIRLAGLASQMQPVPMGEGRVRIMLQAIAEGTQRQNIRLSDMAWDCIESTGDDTREFLYGLCQLECQRREVHQTYLAIYENPVVREHVMDFWRNELQSPRGIPPEIMGLVSALGHDRT